jgi:hypothetical protein
MIIGFPEIRVKGIPPVTRMHGETNAAAFRFF